MDQFFKKFIEWLNLIEMFGSNHILTWTGIYEKKQKMILKKIKLMNNAVFGKTTEN